MANRLTDKQFLDLERRALTLEDAGLMGQYQQALLERNFPEFSRGGVPLHMVGTPDTLYSSRIHAAMSQAYSTSPSSSDLKKSFGLMSRAPTQSEMTSMARLMSENILSGVSSQNVGGRAQIGYTDGQLTFAALVIKPEICKHCSDQISKTACGTATSPYHKRMEAFERFAISEHETAHLISAFKGRPTSFFSRTQLQLAHAEEIQAESYAALRIISKFGQQGVAFLRERMATMANIHDVIPVNDTPTARFWTSYWNVPSYQNILKLYGDKPELLKDKSPAELFSLAGQVMRPFSPAAREEVESLLVDGKTLSTINPVKIFFLDTQTKEYLDTRFGEGRKLLTTRTPEWIAGLREWPGMTPNIKLRDLTKIKHGDEKLDYLDPATLIDMAKFDASLRGGQCTMPYGERLREQTGDPAAAELGRKLLPQGKTRKLD
jgi:hypothetical protein